MDLELRISVPVTFEGALDVHFQRKRDLTVRCGVVQAYLFSGRLGDGSQSSR